MFQNKFGNIQGIVYIFVETFVYSCGIILKLAWGIVQFMYCLSFVQSNIELKIGLILQEKNEKLIVYA